MHSWKLVPTYMICCVTTLVAAAHAAPTTFTFSMHGISGVSAASVAAGAFTMDLAAGPAGSLLYESSGNPALGVGPGGDLLDFDVVNGISEFVEFSFAEPGVLTGIDFDGVKDEALEYFILESSGGVRVNFFDSAANTTIPGAVDNAVLQGVVTGQVTYLLEMGPIDDEAQDLHIPFAAGQVFKLAYAEVGGGLGEAFEPTVVPNGSRLQRITVAPVPEPSARTLSLSAVGIVAMVVAGALLRRDR